MFPYFIENSRKIQPYLLVESIKLWKYCFGKLSSIEIVSHVEELHPQHANRQRISRNLMFLVKIVNITQDAVVEYSTSKIWIFEVRPENKTLLV